MKFKHGTRRRALEYEKDWVARWKADGTFEKSVENRSADNAYVFYDGPPFITGVPHHGTLLSSIVKDAVPRYWTMKGKRVERVWGWDCHGLPAENFVEKQLNIVDRRQIIADTPHAKDSLKFTPELTELVKKGEKTSTFRLGAKNLSVGDTAEFITRYDAETTKPFGFAKITGIKTYVLKDLPVDYEGHETYKSKEEQLSAYKEYYGEDVTLESEFTVYDFEYLGESTVQAPIDKDGNPLPTISLETYINKARESMVANSETWEGVIDRIGRWVDFKGAYRTMDKDFMESVWWAFKRLYEAGKIYEGEKVLMYDTKFATPVSKAEVTMDNDAYQTVTDPSVFVKFKLEKNDVSRRFAGNKLQMSVYIDAPIDKVWDFTLNPENTPKYFSSIKEEVFSELPAKLGTVIKNRGDDVNDWQSVKITEFDEKKTFVLSETGGKFGVRYLFAKEGNGTQFTYEEWNEDGSELDSPPTIAVLESLKRELEGVAVGHDNTSVLAWTTTPWTLPANLMLAVSPELTYCEVLVDGEKLIIAEEALERVLVDEKHQPLQYEILRKFPGSELVGKSYQPLDTGSTWPASEQIHKIYAADFVSHESGTGIVHIAPAYGEDDFELARANGVAAFHVIDDNGYYTDGNYKGLEVWDNNKFIAKDLKEKGIVWKIDYIRHEYPFNPRSKQRIMYRAIPSWFFDIQGQKPLMLEQNENVNWFPEHLKHGRFAKNIEQAPDWNLSRDRFWATAMPVWKGDRGTVKVIGSYAELKELSGVELEDYHRPWVDDITFEIDGETFTRIDKVLDCWFESGSMPFAQLHYPFENREKFEANYPADFIVEYVGQVRAWFYYVHAVNVALAEIGAFGAAGELHKNAYSNVITTGVVAGNDGRKMSKSLGNFTDPNELMDKFSADSLRFLLLSSPLLNGEDFALHDKDVGDVARKLSMIWNMYDFFTMYAEVDGWEFDGELVDPLAGASLTSVSSGAGDAKGQSVLSPSDGKSEPSETESDAAPGLTNPLDIWIVSRLHELVVEVEKHMDGYNIPDALSPILPFLDDASNWYVRRSRRRFWKSEDDGDKNDAYKTLHYVLVRLSYLLAPFTPFLAEELYHNLTGDDESVHLKDWLSAGEIDETVVKSMDLTRKIVNDGLRARAVSGIKVRQPLSQATAIQVPDFLDELPHEQYVYYQSIMAEELNVKTMAFNYEHMNPTPLDFAVKYDLEITPELKREGLMREVIRHVQAARKNAGLQVDDRITLQLATDDAELQQATAEHTEIIAAETLAVMGETSDNQSTVKIEGVELTISLKKQ